MILAMVSDLRVVLVKLADRLHNMRTLQYLPDEKRREIARETLDIYAPIANRLGMGLVKGSSKTSRSCTSSPPPTPRRSRGREEDEGLEATIEKVRARLAAKLAEAGIAGEVTGRLKRYYSISDKMRRRGVDAAELYDILAFRIVTNETRDTYAALGLVHQLWRPFPAGSRTTSRCRSRTSTSRSTRR